MRVAFGPADGNREFFGVDFVNSRMAERLHGPISRPVGGGSSGDATANRVSEVAQVLFERRGSQRRLDHLGSEFGAGLFHRAGARSLWHLSRERRRLQWRHLGRSSQSREKHARDTHEEIKMLFAMLRLPHRYVTD